MSGGVKGGAENAGRVSIPSSVKKTIDHIKEITGQNHSEDEIYAILKECSMDPNETTQKLLHLDTFHEVKRKRDKRKENLNKEPAESKWKPGTQALTNRVANGNYPSRFISNGGGRNLVAAKENVTSPLTERGTNKAPLATAQEMKKNGTLFLASSIAARPNGPSGITTRSTNIIHDDHAFASGGGGESSATGNASISKLEGTVYLAPTVESSKNPNALGTKVMQQRRMLNQSKIANSIPSGPGSYFSSSDHVLLPSQDLPLHSVVGSIQREVGECTPIKLIDDSPTERKLPPSKNPALGVESSNMQPNLMNDSHGVGKNQHLEPPLSGSSTSGSRPSSNHNNRSQVIGPQKVGPGREWKPKATKSTIGHGVSAVASSKLSLASVGSHPESLSTPVALRQRQDTSELQRKLEESHISDRQNVIIPNHLHVPEAEKLGFYFGSFDASFGDLSHNGVPGSDMGPPLSQSSEAIHEPVEEQQLSNQNGLAAVEDTETNYPDQSQSPIEEPEIFSSSKVEVSSSINPEYSESKQEVAPGILQHPVIYPNHNLRFMPRTLNGQLTPLESSESQAHDAPRFPGFIVPQPFDPASYYAQFYGQTSPFLSAGAANKYNGNAAVVSPQTSQSPLELQGGVSLVLSTASPTAQVTRAAGVMQSPLPTQQPLPVFRQPTGVHLPHFPPNYIPYGPYFSQFYVPPPAFHQFLSNGALAQQPQAGDLYPSLTGTTAKYSVSQCNQGSNIVNSAHIGVPGPYGLSMANYVSSSAPAAVTSTFNDDLVAPQLKENNFYVSGQQTEGTGVWFTTPSRDISTIQATSFYNLPQGQLSFNPQQPGHGTFTGVFHPAHMGPAPVNPLFQQSQAINTPADMVGPTTSVYQQQQHAQMNWPSNY